MRYDTIFAAIALACMGASCASGGEKSSADTASADTLSSERVSISEEPTSEVKATAVHLPPVGQPQMPTYDMAGYMPVEMPEYQSTAAVPGSVKVGMKVSDALMVPGATQTVSAIMTGGQITGTVVIQWQGKSYYTNVDFAQEAGYAFGTRYTEPQDIASFIEVACSEAAVPSDFTDKAIVTEQIR